MIRNFLFHRVNPERDQLWDPMDVPLFERCIAYISKKYEVVLIEDLIFSGRMHEKNHFATIMFDDGYKDNIEFAAPILKKYNCKASFYVVTDAINNNRPTWTHILEYLFQFTNKSDIIIDFDFLPAAYRTTRLSSREERIKYVSKLKPYLKKIDHHLREQVLNRVETTFNDIEIPKLMMNWDDVRALRNAGHYIGSHTVHHSMLGTIADEQEVMEELVQSAQCIERELGYFPLTISYPVGSYNATTKRLSAMAGYQIGLAVKQNVYDPDKDDLFEISRIELYNESWWKTRLRISNVLENFKSIIRYR